MTRHIENLARLHNKMRARYGDNDPLVEDLKQELSQVASTNAVAQALPGKCPAPAFAGSGGFSPGAPVRGGRARGRALTFAGGQFPLESGCCASMRSAASQSSNSCPGAKPRASAMRS